MQSPQKTYEEILRKKLFQLMMSRLNSHLL